MSSNKLNESDDNNHHKDSSLSLSSSISSFSPVAENNSSDNFEQPNIGLKSYKLKGFDSVENSQIPDNGQLSQLSNSITQLHSSSPLPSPLPSISSLHSSMDNLTEPNGPTSKPRPPGIRRQVTLNLDDTDMDTGTTPVHNATTATNISAISNRPNEQQKAIEIEKLYRKQFQEEMRTKRRRKSSLGQSNLDQVDSPVRRTSSSSHQLTSVNKPEDIPWKQQKLHAWQPIYRPINIISTFLAIGMLFLAFGVVTLLSMLKVQESIVDYTDCLWQGDLKKHCYEVLQKDPTQKCTCLVNLTLTEDFHQPLFLYYSLDGFYQNHRRYVSSVDQRQLLGRTDLTLKNLDSCIPFRDLNGVPYGPCGAVANSMFTDRFKLYHTRTKSVIHQKETGIAWPIDKLYRFHNPPGDYLEKKVIKPRNWTVGAQWLDPTNPDNNGYQNEHFIVWMRTAAFPTFRKLWSQIDTFSFVGSKNGSIMPKGEYTVEVEYRYQTVSNGLRIPKRLILSNTSWLGGRNLFLPILYLITGSVSILFAIVFVFIVRKYGTPKEQLHKMDSQYQSIARENRNFDENEFN